MTARILILLLFIISASTIQAQKNEAKYSICMRSENIQPDQNTKTFLNSFRLSEEASVQDQFFKIIQFYEIPTAQKRQELIDAGIRLIKYIPHNAYIASFSTDFNRKAESLSAVRSIINIEPEFKLAPELINGTIPDYAYTDDGKVNLIATYFSGIDARLLIDSFLEAGCAILDHNEFSRNVTLNINIQDIEAIAKLPQLLYLEAIGPKPVPDNYTGRTLHRSNAIASDYANGRHYDGSGVAIEIQDDGIIGPHIDYAGRIAEQFPNFNEGNHGDHCSGTLIGGGNLDPRARGTAFGATLYVYEAPPAYTGFANIPEDYESKKIRVTSTSYSDGCNKGYNYRARMLDQQVREFPSLMHIFSAGNDGNSDCDYGAGPGWGNITGGHKTGKNVITVGLVGWDDDLSDMSSRGPAPDGRIKPDVVAKGRNVYSTIDVNSYTEKTGTSMSCPAVAGTTAQLIQAYRELNENQDPGADLLRAILLNTSDDLGNPGPDFKFGFGRVNALKAFRTIEEKRFDTASIDQGAQNIHTINVPAGTEEIKIMVAWTDPEAPQFSNWTLINDLNMTLEDPSGEIWLPWKLSHYPDADSLNKAAVRGIDNRNNVEQITIKNPLAGAYSITIDGFEIPEGPQNYALCWEFVTNEVVLTYPIGGEAVVPGETEIIRWDSYNTSETFLLELSMDEGTSWTTIEENLPGSESYYSWHVPGGNSGRALIRISQGRSVSMSEAPFSIIGKPCNFELDWACGKSVHLSWSPVMGATSYEIMRLGEREMIHLDATDKTSIIVEDPEPTTESWFSVRALGEHDAVGLRTNAIKRQAGNFNCHTTDLMMEEIKTAQWGVFQTESMDLSSVVVSVKIRNYGTETVSDIPLSYQLNNNPEVQETYNGSLGPDETIVFHFSETINISAQGTYTLTANSSCPEDENPDNNSLEKSFEVIEGSTVSSDYIQNFDSWNECTSAPACDLVSCSLEEGWINLTNNIYDDHDWRTYSAKTPSPFTGPERDHTSGNGNYLYLEPSLFCLNKEAIIISPLIDLSNSTAPEFSLWYNAFGPNIGEFHIDLFDGSQITEDICPPILGNQSPDWRELWVDLEAWKEKIIALRFRGITSCGEYGDFAIDDIAFSKITKIEEQNLITDGSLRIFPNPANSSISIEFTHDYKGRIELEIKDIYSRTLKQSKASKEDEKLDARMNMSSLKKGMYFISARNESGELLFVSKIMKL